MSDAYYDVAQVCMNGHVINERFKDRPIHNKEYCGDCGAKTITVCKECDKEIPGEFVVPGFSVVGPNDPAPSYCDKCGKPYPWTRCRIDAFRELVELLTLNPDKKEVLRDGAEHIISDTPKTKLACARLVSVVSKESPLKNIILDIAVKPAKEFLESLWAGAPLA